MYNARLRVLFVTIERYDTMYLSFYLYTTQLYLEILHGQRYQPQKSYCKQDAISMSIQKKPFSPALEPNMPMFSQTSQPMIVNIVRTLLSNRLAIPRSGSCRFSVSAIRRRPNLSPACQEHSPIYRCGTASSITTTIYLSTGKDSNVRFLLRSLKSVVVISLGDLRRLTTEGAQTRGDLRSRRSGNIWPIIRNVDSFNGISF